MTLPLLAELRAIVAAVDVLTPTGFRFAGRHFQEAPRQPKPGEPQPVRPRVVDALQNAFYQYCYVRRFAGSAADLPYAPRQDDDLIPLLQRANPGRERWEGGWTIKEILQSGQVIATRHGATRFLWPGEFVTRDAPGVQPRPGMHVSVFCPRDSPTIQPGFYFVFGEASSDQDAELDLVRIYWNVSDAGAPTLVHHLAGALNRYGVPFRFKTLSRRTAYVRSDAAVLYVNRRFFHISAELADAEVRPRLAPFLRPETPLFTRALFPGIALAEDPETGESFGMARCRVLAEALWEAREEEVDTLDGRMEIVARRYEAEGVDLERPYLNAGSTDRYDLPAAAAAA